MPMGLIWAAIISPLRPVKSAAQTLWLPALAALGAASFGVSALVNGTHLSLGSMGNYLVLGIYVLALSRTAPSAEWMVSFIGLTSFVAVTYLVFSGEGDDRRADFSELWKFTIATPAALTILWLVTKLNSRVIAVLAITGLGVISLLLNFRSLGLTSFIAAIIVLVKGRRGLTKARTAFLAAAIAALALLLPAALASGVFGAEVQARTLRQTSAGGSLLLGGRTEPPLSIAAILARPLMGWGSAGNIDAATFDRAREIAAAVGMSNPSSYYGYWIRPDGTVSLHSILLGGWAEGGVLAAAMPVALIVVLIRAVVIAQGRVAPMVVFASVTSIWDLLFSPWSGNRAVVLATVAALALVAAKEARPPRTASAGERLKRIGKTSLSAHV